MAGAKFTAVPGLNEIVARMCVPAVQDAADEVARRARAHAPATKSWITMLDERVRPTHRKAHGQVVPANLRFEIKSMDWDIQHRGVGPKTYMLFPRDESSRAVANLVNCFPGDTLVSAAGIKKAFRRWYDGPVVRIETQEGRILTGTPNHPVLTQRGWVPLGDLKVGDDLVCQRGSGHGPRGGQAVHGWAEPHEDDAPARIDEVARSLSVHGVHERVGGRPVYFHGDGRDAEVNVVRAEGELHAGRVPKFSQHVGKFLLPDADVLPEVLLPRLGASRARVPSVPSSSPDSLGFLHQALTLLRRHLPVPLTHGSRSGASSDALLIKASVDDEPRNGVALGDRQYGLTLDIPADDLVRRYVEAVPVVLASGLLRLARQGVRLLHLVGRDSVVAEGAVNRVPAHAEFPGQRLRRFASSVSLRDGVNVRDLDGRLPGSKRLPSLDDASIGQPPIEAAGADVQGPSDVGDGFASEVELDRLSSVQVVPFSGEVFNLETSTGWYVGNGIIVHNCRCLLRLDENGIARYVKVTQAKAEGAKASALVYAEGRLVRQAEYGDVYPFGNHSEGTFFMGRAAAEVQALIG